MCNKKILSLMLVLFFIDASVVFTDAEDEKNENIYDEMFLDVQSKIKSNAITLYPTDDAYRTNNLGSWGDKTGNQLNLVVEQRRYFSRESWTLIKFNLSQIPVYRRYVTSAVLRLYKINSGNSGNLSANLRVNIYESKMSHDWQEEDIKCYGPYYGFFSHEINSYRDCFGFCMMKRGNADDGWKEWDVTDSVRGWGGLGGWVIALSPYHVPPNEDGMVHTVRFESKESMHAPELIITYEGEGPQDEVNVRIIQPENMWVYRNGQKWFKALSSFDLPIVFLFGGSLRIQADAGAPSGINRVEFKIGDWFTRNLQEYIDYSAPYEWNWNDPRFGPNIYELNVTAYDKMGNSASDGLLMIRFR